MELLMLLGVVVFGVLVVGMVAAASPSPRKPQVLSEKREGGACVREMLTRAGPDSRVRQPDSLYATHKDDGSIDFTTMIDSDGFVIDGYEDGYEVRRPIFAGDIAHDPEGARDYFGRYMDGYRGRLRECIQDHKKAGIVVTKALTVSPGDDGYYCRRPLWPGKLAHDPEGAREYANRYAKGYRDRLRECIRDHRRSGADYVRYVETTDGKQ